MGIKTGVVVFLFSSFTWAATNADQCSALVKELKAMQSAQKQLMSSFLRKNETMAQVLEQNAHRLDAEMTRHRSIKRSDLKALRVSAQTFRGHDEKERALVSRFEKASAQLLVQVQDCLVNGSKSFKKIGQRE